MIFRYFPLYSDTISGRNLVAVYDFVKKELIWKDNGAKVKKSNRMSHSILAFLPFASPWIIIPFTAFFSNLAAPTTIMNYFGLIWGFVIPITLGVVTTLFYRAIYAKSVNELPKTYPNDKEKFEELDMMVDITIKHNTGLGTTRFSSNKPYVNTVVYLILFVFITLAMMWCLLTVKFSILYLYFGSYLIVPVFSFVYANIPFVIMQQSLQLKFLKIYKRKIF